MLSLSKSRRTLLGLFVGLTCMGALFLGRILLVPRATAQTSMAKVKPEAHVWVDRAVGLYYCSDSAVYRRLSPGQEMTQAEARSRSFRPALGIPCQ